jgi:hypothetical protein
VVVAVPEASGEEGTSVPSMSKRVTRWGVSYAYGQYACKSESRDVRTGNHVSKIHLTVENRDQIKHREGIWK